MALDAHKITLADRDAPDAHKITLADRDALDAHKITLADRDGLHPFGARQKVGLMSASPMSVTISQDQFPEHATHLKNAQVAQANPEFGLQRFGTGDGPGVAASPMSVTVSEDQFPKHATHSKNAQEVAQANPEFGIEEFGSGDGPGPAPLPNSGTSLTPKKFHLRIPDKATEQSAAARTTGNKNLWKTYMERVREVQLVVMFLCALVAAIFVKSCAQSCRPNPPPPPKNDPLAYLFKRQPVRAQHYVRNYFPQGVQ